VHYGTVGDAAVSAAVTIGTRVVLGAVCSAASGGTCAAVSTVNVATAIVTGIFNVGRAAIRSIEGLQNGDRTLTYKYAGGWSERVVIRDGKILRYEMNYWGATR